MARRSLGLLIAVSLVLAACGTPAPDGYEWCFVYDFAASAAGANIQDGEFVPGEGVSSDSTGLLRMNWMHSLTVQPALIIVRAARPESVSGDIDVTANAIIFGVGVSFSETLPGALDEVELSFTPQYADEYGQSANITVDASAPILIKQIEIRGVGANPFPVNYCGLFTPSPSPSETPPATSTPLPTNTPEFTDTPTPSPTPTNTPTCSSGTLNFWGGFTPSYPSPVSIDLIPGSISFSSDEWIRETNSGNDFPRGVWRGARVDGLSVVDFVWQPETLVRADRFVWRDCVCRNCTGSTQTTSVWVNDELVFTGQPGTCGLGDNNSSVSFSLRWVSSVRVRIEQVHGFSAAVFQRGWLNSSCIATATATPTSTAATTHTQTPSPTSTPSPTRTPLPTSTPRPGSGTPSRTPIIIPTLGSPTATVTFTPAPPTAVPATAFPTSTYIPPPTPWMTGTPDGPPGDDFENEAEWQILDAIGAFFNWLINTIGNFFNFLGQIVNWLVGTARNIGILIGNLLALIGGIISSIVDFFAELFEIGRLLVLIVVRIVELIAAWFAQMVARISALLTAFFQAPLQPIPGLPQCVSNPIAHDICAIYYILDHTLFAQGTPGEVLIPLALINLDIWMIIFFARFVLKLVRRGERITYVG